MLEVLEERSRRFGRGRADCGGEAGSFLTLIVGGAAFRALWTYVSYYTAAFQ